MPGFLDNYNEITNKFKISEILKRISNLGLRYEDQVVKQSRAIGQTEAMLMNQAMGDEDFLYSLSLADIGEKKYISYFDKDYKYRREFLRKFALNGEIEWILDTIVDEAIVYDDENYFAYPTFKLKEIFNEEIAEKIAEKIEENFKKIYTYFNFDNGMIASQLFRQFLIDGFLAFEIIYNEQGNEIIGFKQLDPISLIPAVKTTNEGKKKIWIQYPDDLYLKRELFDSQVIYISYASNNFLNRVSYVERLVRPFNLLRIIEHTRIIWNLMNATYRLKIVVPIGTASRQKAQESLNELKNVFKEDIFLDFESGELLVNGRAGIQFYRNYLIPSKNGEQPQIESIAGEGPQLNDTELIEYFNKRLQTDSKIPITRFLKDSSMFSFSSDSIEREEIRFSRFVNKLRSIFQEILVKPLWIQTVLDFPELADDVIFKSRLGLKYNKDNLFEENKYLESLRKKLEIMTNLRDSTTDPETNEPYFSNRFLVEEFLDFDKEMLERNKKYKEIEKKEKEEQGEDDTSW